MKRMQYLSVLELFQGIKFYWADSLSDILENHLEVPFGRDGILIKLKGGYRLSATPRICEKSEIRLTSKEREIISSQKTPIYDHSYADLGKFPYQKDKLDIQIHPQILDEVFPIKNGLEKKKIYGPALFYQKSTKGLFYLIDFKDTVNSGGDDGKLEHKLLETKVGF